VLDEADRMFDLGFITDIRYIMRRLPAPDQRLNLLSRRPSPSACSELAFEAHERPRARAHRVPGQDDVDRVTQIVYFRR